MTFPGTQPCKLLLNLGTNSVQGNLHNFICVDFSLLSDLLSWSSVWCLSPGCSSVISKYTQSCCWSQNTGGACIDTVESRKKQPPNPYICQWLFTVFDPHFVTHLFNLSSHHSCVSKGVSCRDLSGPKHVSMILSWTCRALVRAFLCLCSVQWWQDLRFTIACHS